MNVTIKRLTAFLTLTALSIAPLVGSTPSLAADATPQRIAMSNGLTFPFTLLRSPNFVRHYQKFRTVPLGGNATYTNIELTYVNFVEITGGELTDYPPVTVQAEILYQGVYYPVTFNGQPSAVMTGGGSVTGQVAGLALPAGAHFYERVRLVGALRGEQDYLVSHGSRRALMEGVIGGTDAAQNLLGGQDGHGATCSFTMQSGEILGATLTAAGVNYTTSAVIAAYDPMTQAEKTIGYADQDGGQISNIVLTDGITGLGFSDKTQCLITGGGGFGADAAIYASAMITGTPDVGGLQALLIVGDSIARGFGSTDGKGDDWGSYGIFERAAASRYATASTAIPGNRALAYKMESAHRRMNAIVLPYVTHALINLGTNDLALGASASSVARANNDIASELRRAGIKVSFATVIPRASGSYGTLDGQTPVAGFTTGGAADTYNAWVRAGIEGLASDWGFVDADAVYRDSTWQNKWRVDSLMTLDGIHPSGAIGVPFGAMNLAFRFGNLTPVGQDYTSVGDITSYANNAIINVAATVKKVMVYGSNVTINGGTGSYTLSAPAGGNTVNTGAGEATVNVDGIYTKINLGSGNSWINDQGTYNLIRLAPAGSGLATISGRIFQNGTQFDLRTLLASTSWNGDSTQLNRYLNVSISEGAALLTVTPDGNGGQNYTAAKLTSYDSLSLDTVLRYSKITDADY